MPSKVTASSATVREFMRRLPRSHTTPELELRRALHQRGVRFRLHRPDLPGRPDIVLVRAHLAVFVDGCFWHGCPLHAVAPKSNARFWATKIAENRRRDRRKDRHLATLGWSVIHVWEHEDPQTVADQIALAWAGGRRRVIHLQRVRTKSRSRRAPTWLPRI